MPTNLTIPEHIKRVCTPCEHHKCIAALHVRIGSGGYREYACTHPDAFEPTDNPLLAQMHGRLMQMDGGRVIGKTENRPEWCPLFRNHES